MYFVGRIKNCQEKPENKIYLIGLTKTYINILPKLCINVFKKIVVKVIVLSLRTKSKSFAQK